MRIDRRKNRKPHNYVDLTNQKFGKLTIIGDSKLRKSKRVLWLCKCDCGVFKNILGKYLLNGDTKSCGCFFVNNAHNRNAIGGITLSFWTPIIKQAEKRGIPFEVDRDFCWELYLKQNGKCKLSGLDIIFSSNIRDQRSKHTCSLDRINNELGYTKTNVQWVHKKVNIMKNIMSNDEFIKWCKIIYKTNDKDIPTIQ